MPNQIIQLRDPKDSTKLFNPVTSANAVLCDKGGGQIGTLQSIISAIMQAQGGGGGGGSTVTIPGSDVTLSTTISPYITVDGITRSIKLPSSSPWSNPNLEELSNVTITSPNADQVLKYNGSGWVNDTILSVLPSITGNSGKVLAVNSGATGIEWITPSGGGSTVIGKTVTLSTTGQAVIQVNGTDSGTVALPSSIPSTWLGATSNAASAGDHSHGNIQNGGTLTSDISIATGDKIVITDSSDSNKIARASLTFDTTNTTDFLRKDGTWATPAGGGGTTVTLPSGYSASTGITLSSSSLTTIATVGGVDLKLKAPSGGGGGGSTIAYTSQDSNRAGETPISQTTLANRKGTYVGDLTIDNANNPIIVPPAHLNHSVEEENFTGLGTVKPMFVSEIFDRDGNPAFVGDEVFNPQGYVLKMPISGPGSGIEWALIPIICDVHHNADTGRYESVPYVALPSALLNDYIGNYWNKDGMIPVEPQELKE